MEQHKHSTDVGCALNKYKTPHTSNPLLFKTLLPMLQSHDGPLGEWHCQPTGIRQQ